MKHNHKAAIDLSINLIVTVIISLVILGGGIALLYKFIGGAEQVKTDLDQRTSQELERLLIDEGKQVALPLHTVNINRGDSHVFGLGVLNIGPESDFLITVQLIKVVDAQNQDITAQIEQNEPATWLLYNQESIHLQENEAYKEAILVEIPTTAPAAQYIFSARVISNNEPYGNPQTFYVNAK